ncbi:MAG: hypothetical protein QW304_07605 [Thermoproteota archaeon]
MVRVLRWYFPVLRKLSGRPTLIFEKPPIHEVFEKQVMVFPVGVVDGDIDEMVRRKRGEWTTRGFRSGLQDMAVNLASEWTSKIVEWHLRNLRDVLPEEELKKITKSLTVNVMKQALDSVAERWISAMQG